MEEKQILALSWTREIVTALLAISIVAGSAVAIIFAARQIANESLFKASKDILLFINPMLGVVIGYYFNKTASENRSDRADAVARAATQQAIDANAGKANADEKRRTATNMLVKLTSAANAAAGSAGLLGGQPTPDAHFQEALHDAEQYLQNAT